MSASRNLIGIAGLVLLLAGCLTAPGGTASAPSADSVTQDTQPAGQVTIEATVPLPGAGPTQPVNTELQFLFTTYEHQTNVFRISIPETWTVRDDSTDERVLVVLEPPLGFASRVTIDITFEGNLAPDELQGLTSGYLNLYYGSDPNYAEINRADLPDGRLQVTQLYNNPAGASGRETAYLSFADPYFAAMRAFVSDNELVVLTPAIEQIVDSLTINPTARWGQTAVEVDLNALQLQGVNGWTDAAGNFWIMGRVFNGWFNDIEFVSVSAGVCDPSGAVLGDGSGLLLNDVISQSTVAPFAIKFGPVIESQPRPCLMEISAQPAGNLSEQTYSQFEVTHSASFDAEDENPTLSVSGVVQNTGNQPVSLIDVIIAIYDSFDGNVIGYAVTSTEAAQLLSGDASFFSHDFTLGDIGAPAETFTNWVIELWVQGNPVETLPETDTPPPDEASLTPTPAPPPGDETPAPTPAG